MNPLNAVKAVKAVNFKALAKTGRLVVREQSPVILTAAAAVGAVATAVLGVKAGVKAGAVIEEVERDLEDNRSKPARFADRASHTWKIFLPTAAAAIGTVTCVVGANKISMNRAAALSAAYALSDRAFAEYREKVLDTVGVKKAEKILEETDKAAVEANPAPGNIIIANGEMLMFDKFTGRYFKKTMDELNLALTRVNFSMSHEGAVSLNEFYSHLELDTIPVGEDLGWNSDHGLLEYRMSSQIADNGQPCLVVDFNRAPGVKFYFGG